MGKCCWIASLALQYVGFFPYKSYKLCVRTNDSFSIHLKQLMLSELYVINASIVNENVTLSDDASKA